MFRCPICKNPVDEGMVGKPGSTFPFCATTVIDSTIPRSRSIRGRTPVIRTSSGKVVSKRLNNSVQDSSYMAEFLGMGDRGTARHIYFQTLWFQMALASLASVALVLWVFHDASSEYRIPAALIALSIWPAMVNEISAQGNVASEDLSANLPGSVLSMIFFFAVFPRKLL